MSIRPNARQRPSPRGTPSPTCLHGSAALPPRGSASTALSPRLCGSASTLLCLHGPVSTALGALFETYKSPLAGHKPPRRLAAPLAGQNPPWRPSTLGPPWILPGPSLEPPLCPVIPSYAGWTSILRRTVGGDPRSADWPNGVLRTGRQRMECPPGAASPAWLPAGPECLASPPRLKSVSPRTSEPVTNHLDLPFLVSNLARYWAGMKPGTMTPVPRGRSTGSTTRNSFLGGS